MKRVITIVMALVLLVGVMSVSAFADNGISVTISDGTAKVGEEFSVDISVSGNPGFASLTGDLTYDHSVLQVVSISGLISTGTWQIEGDNMMWYGNADYTDNGVIATVTFKVLETAAGNDTIGIDFDGGGWNGIFNYNEETVTPSVDNGTYTFAHDHSYSAVVTEPTCTEEGYTTYTCGCGESYVDDKVAAKGHNYVKDETKSVAATCNTDGKDVLVCSGCGDVKEEVVKATGDHNFVVEVERVEATCEADGYVKYACGCGTVSEDETVLPKLGHKFENYTETKAPTCTDKGEAVAECENGCGEKDTKEIAALGHDYVEVNHQDPTCTAEGFIEYECARSGCDVGEGKPATTADILKKVDHTWGEWEVIKEATKTEQGEKKHTCAVCGYTETEATSATGSVAPKTGDEANIALYAVMFVMAGAAVVALSTKKKEN